jgi:hypothetical protein
MIIRSDLLLDPAQEFMERSDAKSANMGIEGSQSADSRSESKTVYPQTATEDSVKLIQSTPIKEKVAVHDPDPSPTPAVDPNVVADKTVVEQVTTVTPHAAQPDVPVETRKDHKISVKIENQEVRILCFLLLFFS